MPKNNRLLLFFPMLPRRTMPLAWTFWTFGPFLLLVTKKVESMNGPILITLPNLKLLRILRESTDKIIPVIKMVGIVMVRVKP